MPAANVNMVPITVEPEKRETHHGDKRVCYFYRNGNCHHGGDGKIAVKGKVCSFSHPKKCPRFCRYGFDRTRGCNRYCNLFHPRLCQSALNVGICYDKKCTLQHLVGSVRYFNNIKNHSDGRNGNFPPVHSHMKSNISYNGNNRQLPISNFSHNNAVNTQFSSESFPPLPRSSMYKNENYSLNDHTVIPGNENPLEKILMAISKLEKQSSCMKEEFDQIKARFGNNPFPQNNNRVSDDGRNNAQNNYPPKNYVNQTERYVQ